MLKINQQLFDAFGNDSFHQSGQFKVCRFNVYSVLYKGDFAKSQKTLQKEY